MLDVYESLYPGSIPTKQIMQAATTDQVQNQLHITFDDILNGLDGQIIADRYAIEFTARFLRYMLDQPQETRKYSRTAKIVLKMRSSGRSESEIKAALAAELGISAHGLRTTLNRAIEHLSYVGKLSDFQDQITELVRLQTRNGTLDCDDLDEIEIIEETTIEVAYVD